MKLTTFKGIGTLLSFLLMAVGAAIVYPPAGLIVFGAFLFWDMNFGDYDKPGRIL